MPRLDNSNQTILALVRTFGAKWAAKIRYTADSPDATPDVDVCTDCLKGFFRFDVETKEHSPYTKENLCCMCGKAMEEEGEP